MNTNRTADQAAADTTTARAIIAQAQAVAANLAAFNTTCQPLRELNHQLKAQLPTGTAVHSLNAPKRQQGMAGTIVGYTGSHYGYSLATVRYAGTKRTYSLPIFSLFTEV